MKKGGTKEHERDIRLAVTLLSTLLYLLQRILYNKGLADIGFHKVMICHSPTASENKHGSLRYSEISHKNHPKMSKPPYPKGWQFLLFKRMGCTQC